MSSLRRRAQTSRVSVYLGPRTFYTKDMENKHRVGQTDVGLPPRCFHCRRSWDTSMKNDVVHCEEHRRECDNTCEEADEWNEPEGMM